VTSSWFFLSTQNDQSCYVMF